MMAFALVLTTSLLLQTPADTPPPGWREAMSKALDLTIEGKDLEVVAMWEKWVAQYPKFGEARMMLGAAHESAARSIRTGRAPGGSAARDKHYEAAILQMRRAMDEAGSRVPFDWTRSFIDIHGLLGVNRPADYERLVHEAVKRHPAEPLAHGYLIALLAERNQPIDAAATAARAAIPRNADARATLASSLAQHARDFGPLMPAAGPKALLAEASSLVDEALKMSPKDAYALRTKSLIEQLRK